MLSRGVINATAPPLQRVEHRQKHGQAGTRGKLGRRISNSRRPRHSIDARLVLFTTKPVPVVTLIPISIHHPVPMLLKRVRAQPVRRRRWPPPVAVDVVVGDVLLLVLVLVLDLVDYPVPRLAARDLAEHAPARRAELALHAAEEAADRAARPHAPVPHGRAAAHARHRVPCHRSARAGTAFEFIQNVQKTYVGCLLLMIISK